MKCFDCFSFTISFVPKIVIDTSDIIANKNNAFTTKRVNCFIEKETEIAMSLSAPKGSILNRLYEKTILNKDMLEEKLILKSDRCLIKKDSSVIVRLARSHLFFTGSETASYFFLAFISQFDLPMKGWMLDKDIYEYNTVLYYNLRNPENKRMVEKL